MRIKHTEIGSNPDKGSFHSLSNAKFGLELRVKDMWDVEADDNYRIIRDSKKQHKYWVFIRTYKGSGYIYTRAGDKHKCSEYSWLIMSDDDIYKYLNESSQLKWSFSWIVFEGPADLSKRIICNEIHQLPIEPEEADIAAEIRETIEDPFSSSLAGTCLSRWILRIDRRHRQIALGNKTNRIVQLACTWLSRNPGSFPNVGELAKECFISSRYLQSSFQEVLLCSPKAFLEKRCLTRAMNRLMFTNESISEIADALGFSSPFHLSTRFKKYFGYPPSHVRKQN